MTSNIHFIPLVVYISLVVLIFLAAQVFGVNPALFIAIATILSGGILTTNFIRDRHRFPPNVIAALELYVYIWSSFFLTVTYMFMSFADFPKQGPYIHFNSIYTLLNVMFAISCGVPLLPIPRRASLHIWIALMTTAYALSYVISPQLMYDIYEFATTQTYYIITGSGPLDTSIALIGLAAGLCVMCLPLPHIHRIGRPLLVISWLISTTCILYVLVWWGAGWTIITKLF